MNVNSELQPLLEKAWAQTPALHANEMISRMREEAQPGSLWTSYEWVYPQGVSLVAALEKTIPALVYFLDCHGAKLPQATGVFVSLFLGETLYFLRAADVVEFSTKVLGVSFTQLLKRYGQTSANQGALLLT